MDRKNRLDALTGVRFLAAFMVLAFHLWPAPKTVGAIPFYRAGNIGVPFFFVLSGFILGYNYLDRADSMSPKDFYWARFARIYPVYLLGALLAIVWIWHDSGLFRSLASFLLTLTLLQAWLGRYALYGNGVAWTLSVETFFYALFPWIARRVIRFDERKAFALIVVSSISFFALQALFHAIAPQPEGQPPTTHLMAFFACAPLWHLLEFVAGVALARYYTLRPLISTVGTADAIVVGSAAVIWLLSMSVWRLTIAGSLILPFCALIYALASGKGVFASILGSRLFVLLGEASYAMYILHIVLNRLTSRFFEPYNPYMITVFVIVVSVFVFTFFEKPARTFLMNRGKVRRREIAPTPP